MMRYRSGSGLNLLFCGLLLIAQAEGGFASQESTGKSSFIHLDRRAYEDRLRGFWLGSCIANWTGLRTENARTTSPFFTDDDWQTAAGHNNSILDFVLDHDPWGADDDTDIEYIYQHAIEKYGDPVLSPEQISAEWQAHIGLPLLWVSNLAALGQMQDGALPPETSLPRNNPMWDMIDAQLTTEIFGALAPARPDAALKMAHLPIRTTAYLHSKWAAEFYIIMYSLAAVVDTQLSRKEQLQWLAEQARHRLPEWSYLADMYDFVKSEYQAHPENWEQTRDRLYERYQLNSTAQYHYKYPWDSGINFAASIVSLLYGEGDFKETVRIATLAGWDSDNPAATWGGLFGLLYGHTGLQAHFDKDDFSDIYWIARTRFDLPVSHDNFTSMSRRGVTIIDQVVASVGGEVTEQGWVIPVLDQPIEKIEMKPVTPSWQTIEDDDSRWSYEGFITRPEQWNASGATLTTGEAGCRAEIEFVGSAVQYYAYKHPSSGSVKVFIDDVEKGDFDLSSMASTHGQYYMKIFEEEGLPLTSHRLRIECDGTGKQKSIDMITISGESPDGPGLR